MRSIPAAHTLDILRFDEPLAHPYAAGVTETDPIRCIQTWYPQIYLACHIDHKRPRTTGSGISARDSSILAHLDQDVPMTAASLARHLGIGAPAMSATLKRLVQLGYVAQQTDAADARRRHLRLTGAGARAMRESSVLEPSRLRRMLRRLTNGERERALEGLALLARAARETMTRQRS